MLCLTAFLFDELQLSMYPTVYILHLHTLFMLQCGDIGIPSFTLHAPSLEVKKCTSTLLFCNSA